MIAVSLIIIVIFSIVHSMVFIHHLNCIIVGPTGAITTHLHAIYILMVLISMVMAMIILVTATQ